MIKTIQLILYSWYLDTIDFIEFIGEHIHQFLFIVINGMERMKRLIRKGD